MFETPAASASETRMATIEKLNGAAQLRLDFVLQKNRGNADANLAKGLPFALNRQLNVVNLRRCRIPPELLQETSSREPA